MFRRLCTAAFIAFLGSTWVLSQQDPIHFRVLPIEGEQRPGSLLTVTLRATVEPTWHLYALTPYPEDTLGPQPTRITVKENPIFALAGEVSQPPPRIDYDPNFEIDTQYFAGIADFEVPIKIQADAPEGRHLLELLVRFMACNDQVCLPPQEIDVTTSLLVSGPPLLAEPASGPSDRSADSGANWQDAGAVPGETLAYLLFAMACGGLALLTPCVFPMIPITVSYFTKRNVSRRQAVAEAALYALGIVLTFTLIGFLFTLLWGAGGINRVAASPGINIAIAALFLLFALSLFGAIEIRLPSSWLSRLDRESAAIGGPVGILLMALAFSLTSFTCTVPFVGTVMVAATQGDWAWSLLGITAFAAVFATPFFFLAIFPSWLKSLPRSGSWMNSIKITMGFLELAAALKFISNVDLVYQMEIVTRPVFITVWIAIAVTLALYLLGRFSFPHEEPAQQVGTGRVLGAIFFLSLSFYLLRGLFGAPLGELDAFLPPRDYGSDQWMSGSANSQNSTAPEGEWYRDYNQALDQARSSGKPLFVDFTGYTCTNCRWMESNIFTRPQVVSLLRNFVLVRLYTDGGRPEHEANLRMQRQRFQTIALPLYAIVSPDDEVLATLPGLTRSEEAFVSFLERGLRSASSLPPATE